MAGVAGVQKKMDEVDYKFVTLNQKSEISNDAHGYVLIILDN